MPDALTAAEILASAADLVEFSGRWAPEPDERSGIVNPICAMWAMCEAGCLDIVSSPAFMALQREIGGEKWFLVAVPTWNARATKEEVAGALRNAKRHLPSDEAGA